MSGISLTASMRSNLLSLQNIAGQQDIVQNRLATGLKVSSAIDNPSSYYTASSLNNRAADLTALLDAMSQGVQTIKAASEAIDSGTKFLEQAKAVANQALETAQPVIARVSNEAELLAAIDSGQRGLIVAEGTITLSDNTSLYLKDGQSLVGARYLDKTAAETTINFNFDGIIDNGIEAGNNSLISDLNINFNSNLRGGNRRGDNDEKAVILLKDKQDVRLNNLNISVDTSPDTAVSGFFSIKLIRSSGTIAGNINISTAGNYTRGIYAASNSHLDINNAHINNMSTGVQSYLFQSYFDSVINVNGSSEINLAMKGSGAAVYLYSSGKINFNDQSCLNVSTKLASGSGIYGGVGNNKISFNDDSQVNIESTNNGYCVKDITLILNDRAQANLMGSNGFKNSHLYLNSAEAMLNVDTTKAFSTTEPPVHITAAAGAKFATQEKYYIAAGNVSDMVVNDPNLNANFQIDASKTAEIDSAITAIFADFDNHMAENQTKEESQNNNYAGQYSEIIKQYDMLISDASYKGINLLEGQYLKINFNEDRSSKIDVPGVKADSESLGLKTKEWKTAEDVEKSVAELEEAIGSLRSFASEFGNYYSIVTTRQDFTENLINVLEEGADKLTLADMNQESANMLALQTAQQLAVNSLSLASQASQSILRLF